MSEFVNTIDLLGDEVVIDSIIDRSIAEFRDDQITEVGVYAFYECVNLSVVDVPNANSIGTSAFRGCSALAQLILPNVTDVGATLIAGSSVTKIVLPRVKKLYSNALRECETLTVIDLTDIEQIGSYMFYGSIPTALILRGSKVCVIDSNAFSNSGFSGGKGYFYVPSALIEDYKSATNWSKYADQFRALEDYTVDGTITGELDETKI